MTRKRQLIIINVLKLLLVLLIAYVLSFVRNKKDRNKKKEEKCDHFSFKSPVYLC